METIILHRKNRSRTVLNSEVEEKSSAQDHAVSTGNLPEKPQLLRFSITAAPLW